MNFLFGYLKNRKYRDNKERNLEIGPSPKEKIDKSWETMDIIKKYNPDYIHDIKEPMPFIKDNTFNIVYTSHLLEHVPWYNVESVLKELIRIIKPGGFLEIWVPDFEKIVQVYMKKEFPDDWRLFNPEEELFKWILGRVFAYDRDGENDWNFHRGAFDEKYLRECLEKTGFSEITKLEKPRTVDHGWINLGICGRKPQNEL